MTREFPQPPDDNWMFTGGGDMCARTAAFDWATTPVGPIAGWPRSLKNTVALLLQCRHPMFLWWGDDLIQFYNDAYVPSFGAGKHPAALGQRGRECWPEIWDIIGPQIEDVMREGRPSWHEDALVPIFRNGRIEDVYWTYGYSPVFDDDGSISGTLVVCTETTSRVVAARTEAALRAERDHSLARLQQFFSQAPAGICILRGPDLTFEFANDVYRALVGGRDVVGRPLLEALPELDGQGFDLLLHNVMTSGDPFVGRERAIRLDRGGTGILDDRFYTFIYSPLRDGAGQVEAVIVLALDVTDEVNAKRQMEGLAVRLRDSEAQFHLLAETIPQLAWSTRADGYIDWYNRRWYEYTGTTFESMEGWGWRYVHDPAMVDDVLTRWQAALDHGESFEMEFPLRRHDGQLRWHLTLAVPLRDESGRIVRWFGTNTDIDASRRAAEERAVLLESTQRARLAAEMASRAKDDFLSTASHELRTPLNAILGWARLLQSGQLSAADLSRAFDTIERNARIQVRLIDDILDGSRIITGKLHLELRTLDLTTLIEAAIEAVRPAADAKQIALSLLLDPSASRVVGDPERLQQVIWNLANNAIKFTPRGGAVTVSLSRVGADVQIAIADSGEGIDPEFLAHVFERFRQAEGSTTRRHGGLGLGLALVRHLVEAHGGTVRADSPGVGLGATFTIRLPERAVAVAPASTPHTFTARARVSGSVDLRGTSILIVDDEPDARDLVATALRAHGAEIATAASVSDALARLSEREFAVMISDIGMPGADGYELIRHVRASSDPKQRHMPAVALTAYSREEDRRLALDAGFHDYVAKPVEPDHLAAIVARVTGATE